MAVDLTKYDINFRAPALPYAPAEYNQEAFEQFNNVLRLYFNQLDKAVRDAMATNENYYFEIAQGNIAGYAAQNVFGFNATIGTSYETVWDNGGAYTFLSSAQQLSVVSSSASDTMNLLITGLDSSYDVISETITLTGTSAVTTTNSYLRVNSAVITSGSNVGNITATYSATTVFYITAGVGTTQMCVFTVPNNKTLYLVRIDLTSGTANGNQYITYRNRLDTSTGRVLRVAEATFVNNQQSFDRQVPFKITEKTDFQFEAKSSASTNELSVFVEGILVDD